MASPLPMKGAIDINAAPAPQLRKGIVGATLIHSETARKQMAFRFDNGTWLGVHLGMTGELSTRVLGQEAGKHDHLVIDLEEVSLVFTDPRMFGGVRFHPGPDAPEWWTRITPALLSPAFTLTALSDFLRRRARAPIKAVLLMQERFPGIGNWMADEILWRCGHYPGARCATLTKPETRELWKISRRISRDASPRSPRSRPSSCDRPGPRR